MDFVKRGVLERRWGSCTDYNDNGYCDDAWDGWARWLVPVVIVVAALLIFFVFSCVSARRRRRLGYQPYRGTGWAGGRNHGPVTYNAQPYYQQTQAAPYYNNSNNPPPAYTPPPNGGMYGQQNDVELQQPQQTYGGYRGAEYQGVYEPPKGPPPGRN